MSMNRWSKAEILRNLVEIAGRTTGHKRKAALTQMNKELQVFPQQWSGEANSEQLEKLLSAASEYILDPKNNVEQR
jgi:hypothetical protein